MRIVTISDTHNRIDNISIPDGDVLVHSGDFCRRGSVKEAEEFAKSWLALPHKYKVVIAGNHDFCMQNDLELGNKLLTQDNSYYLFDSYVTVEGVKFYGAPWQPWFYDWAFNLSSSNLKEKWDLIPSFIDVLITHGPPQSILDRCSDGRRVGCNHLLDTIVSRVKPALHIFGHIHESYGIDSLTHSDTVFINASSCTLQYVPKNLPIVVDLDTKTLKVTKININE